MFKFLRVPEKIFGLVMWLVSLAFATFLIGLGGKVVADLPRLGDRVTIDDYVTPRDALPALRSELRTLEPRVRDAATRQQQGRLALDSARNAYNAARATHQNWLATRTATTDPSQDPEVIRRTRELDELKSRERQAQVSMEAIEREQLDLAQRADALRVRESDLLRDAQAAFQRAQFWQELRVFGARLALTLPLLVIAGALWARKRGSDYWPLHRGFVLFAVFTFFVELVPYLPSYGGYVRYTVGVIATAIVGHYVIKAMRRYLAQRQAAAKQSEAERRHALSADAAVKKLAANVCPACERAVMTTDKAPANFCVHCGLKLFDECGNCHTRKNAFFHYCPSCGSVGAGQTA
ncbi:MAG: zinc ribbon domain-containing protein [Aquincola sp.]|nr:zinc ribbon domain-containing protein [Aquincola sp.]MDH5328859.1 zinc ribbon domain-containing protein [Aquincola sp.]